MKDSLFHKYGGFATVGNIVHSFYEKVIDHETLAPYFDGIDMERLMSHQTDFMCQILDGPVNYSGRDLRSAHRRLHVTEEDFQEMTDVLEETFEEAGFDDDDIEIVMKAVRDSKSDVMDEEAAGSPESASIPE